MGFGGSVPLTVPNLFSAAILGIRSFRGNLGSRNQRSIHRRYQIQRGSRCGIGRADTDSEVAVIPVPDTHYRAGNPERQ